MSSTAVHPQVEFDLSTIVGWRAKQIRPGLSRSAREKHITVAAEKLIDDLRTWAGTDDGCPMSRAALDELVISAAQARLGGTEGCRQRAVQLMTEAYGA